MYHIRSLWCTKVLPYIDIYGFFTIFVVSLLVYIPVLILHGVCMGSFDVKTILGFYVDLGISLMRLEKLI